MCQVLFRHPYGGLSARSSALGRDDIELRAVVETSCPGRRPFAQWTGSVLDRAWSLIGMGTPQRCELTWGDGRFLALLLDPWVGSERVK